MIVKKLENKNYKKIDSKGFYDGCHIRIRELFKIDGTYIAKREYHKGDGVYIIKEMDGTNLKYPNDNFFHNSNLIFIK